MPVEVITESLLIEPNHVVIIAEQRDLHFFEGAFRINLLFRKISMMDNTTLRVDSLAH